MKRSRELINQENEPPKNKRFNDVADQEISITASGILHTDILFHIFSFLRGRDLNKVRFVCSQWHNVIFSDYFKQEQCKILKLAHDQYVEIDMKTQVKRVFMELGLKQGEMVIRWKDEQPAKSKDQHLTPKAITHYKNGQKHGTSIVYFKDGSVSCEGCFREGKKHGQFVEMFPKEDNLIKCESNYLDDKLHGKLVEYMLVKRGHGKVRVKTNECEYFNGKFHGTRLEYDRKTDTVLKRIDYKHGKLHGKYIRHYPDGKKEYESDYENGVAIGKEIRYYRDGIHPCEVRTHDTCGNSVQFFDLPKASVDTPNVL